MMYVFMFVLILSVVAAASAMYPAAEILPLFINFGIIGIFFLWMFFNAWLSIGFFRFYGRIVRGDGADYALLFSGGNVCVKAALYMLLLVLIIYVPFALLTFRTAYALHDDNIRYAGDIIDAVGITLAVLQGFAWAFFMPGYWLIADRGMGVIGALRLSLGCSKINIGTILALGIWAFLLGALLMGLGLIIAVPYVFMLMAVFCMLCTGERFGEKDEMV